MKYKVIAKKNLDTLNRHTRKWIDKGWKVRGCVAHHHIDGTFEYFTEILYKEKS